MNTYDKIIQSYLASGLISEESAKEIQNECTSTIEKRAGMLDIFKRKALAAAKKVPVMESGDKVKHATELFSNF